MYNTSIVTKCSREQYRHACLLLMLKYQRRLMKDAAWCQSDLKSSYLVLRTRGFSQGGGELIETLQHIYIMLNWSV